MKMIGKIQAITADFPQPGKVTEIQTGFNYKYLNTTYSFHYNKFPNRPNRLVSLKRVVEFFSGQELTALRRLMPLVSESEMPKPKPIVKEKPKSTGTQACIDHIERKLEVARKAKAKITVFFLYQSLIDELKQYL